MKKVVQIHASGWNFIKARKRGTLHKSNCTRVMYLVVYPIKAQLYGICLRMAYSEKWKRREDKIKGDTEIAMKMQSFAVRQI